MTAWFRDFRERGGVEGVAVILGIALAFVAVAFLWSL